MSACSTQSFNNVTPAVWQCGVSAAANLGVTITTNSGSASKSGFTVAWNYNPQSQTCSIQCTDSPWYVPCSAINSFIDSTVSKCFSDNNAEITAML